MNILVNTIHYKFDIMNIRFNYTINKYENIIKVLPNANDATRDSIWKSELTKPEQSIK